MASQGQRGEEEDGPGVEGLRVLGSLGLRGLGVWGL